jgi:hypothetical protein
MEMEMKAIRGSIALVVLVLLSAPMLRAQDVSKYRNFSLGMTVADLAKRVDANPADAAVIYEHPALIQELTWWPPQPYDSSHPAEPVEQIRFSFYNGALYRMLVSYDASAVEGLTNEDMIRAVSAEYGTFTRPVAEVSFPTDPLYGTSEKVIARWENSLDSVDLFRSSSSNAFGLVLFSKQADAQAGASIADSLKLEQNEAPQKEAARAKKQADDLEADRQKNIKTIHP